METDMNKKFLALASLLMLSACFDEYSGLQGWMDQVRQEAKAKVRPPEAPAKVEPVTYFPPELTGTHAFNEQRLRAAFQNSSAPDMNRTKELLENYSLENLKFVGSIGRPGRLSGLIEAEVDGEKKVYTVRPGNYLGQNYGRITRITADKIDIVEVVEDAEGNWVNRSAELTTSPAD